MSVLDNKYTTFELYDAYCHISGFLPPRNKHEAKDTFDELIRSYNMMYLMLVVACNELSFWKGKTQEEWMEYLAKVVHKQLEEEEENVKS